MKPFDFSHRLSVSIKSAVALVLITLCLHQQAHTQIHQKENYSLSREISPSPDYRFSAALNSAKKDTVPKPLGVMYKSMFIPGWGQAVNKQYWKIPIIYAAIGGVVGYTIYLDGKYGDYRAAYYNSFADPEQETYTDQKFGPTPGYLENVVVSQLRNNRNYFRNTRDLMFVMTGLAYGLNILDAYIFAHLRDFDVSDDLSLRAQPSFNGNHSAITLTFNF